MQKNRPAFAFALASTVFVSLTIHALLRGRIKPRDVVFHRSSQPLRYFAWLAAYAGVASILIITSVYLFRHPGAFPVNDDIDADVD